MTGKSLWTGFVCVRPRDGFFAALSGRDLSTEQPVHVRVGTDSRLRSFHSRSETVISYGRRWTSSDAELVACSVSRAAVRCRHWRDVGFGLGLHGDHRTF
jgi:hypothetical protein